MHRKIGVLSIRRQQRQKEFVLKFACFPQRLEDNKEESQRINVTP